MSGRFGGCLASLGQRRSLENLGSQFHAGLPMSLFEPLSLKFRALLE
jgi:hypothetical protein